MAVNIVFTINVIAKNLLTFVSSQTLQKKKKMNMYNTASELYFRIYFDEYNELPDAK